MLICGGLFLLRSACWRASVRKSSSNESFMGAPHTFSQ